MDADGDEDANAEGRRGRVEAEVRVDRAEAEGHRGREEAEVPVGRAEAGRGEEGRQDTLIICLLPARSLNNHNVPPLLLLLCRRCFSFYKFVRFSL